jgi:zinc protease
MMSSAFTSHPYRHETIGFREDIERYTAPMLEGFYRRFYDPSNATLTIIGDIQEEEALSTAVATFGNLKTNGTIVRNVQAVEPKQEGLRRVAVERESTTNIVAFGVKHAGFPHKDWFEVQLLASILTEGPESILYKKLVDTGLASKISMSVEPTREMNLGVLYVTLTKKTSHAEIEKIVLSTIDNLTLKEIAPLYKKVQQRIITSEIFGRESSLAITQELTEYISAGAWEEYFNTEAMIKRIGPKDLISRAKTIFKTSQMVIGHFVGSSNKK